MREQGCYSLLKKYLTIYTKMLVIVSPKGKSIDHRIFFVVCLFVAESRLYHSTGT